MDRLMDHWWTIDGPCRSNDVKCKALGPADVCPVDNFITQGDHRSLDLCEYGQAEKTIDALQQARMVTGTFR